MYSGQIGIAAGAAANLANIRSAENDRVNQDQAVRKREQTATTVAEQAEGIGVTQEEAATGERDADGRRPWEFKQSDKAENAETTETSADLENEHPHAKDPTGQAGTQLDIDG